MALPILRKPVNIDNQEIHRTHCDNLARIIAAGLSTGKNGPTHDAEVKKAILLYLDIVQANIENQPGRTKIDIMG